MDAYLYHWWWPAFFRPWISLHLPKFIPGFQSVEKTGRSVDLNEPNIGRCNELLQKHHASGDSATARYIPGFENRNGSPLSVNAQYWCETRKPWKSVESSADEYRTATESTSEDWLHRVSDLPACRGFERSCNLPADTVDAVKNHLREKQRKATYAVQLSGYVRILSGAEWMMRIFPAERPRSGNTRFGANATGGNLCNNNESQHQIF